MQPQEQINLHIAEQPEWQRRQMIRLRQLIHTADEEIEETWRSNAPHFEHNGTIASLHALKTCVSVWFPKGSSLKDNHDLFQLGEKDNERELRKYKLHEGDVINEKAFVELVKQSIKLNLANAKSTEEKPVSKALVLPPELDQVLQNDEDALAQWEKFPEVAKREYVEWITDAKQDEQRKRRIAKALEMIRDGQRRNDAQKVG